ncbi:MAG TPA: hypothetical protein VGO57_13270, partial [Verrucomicrobiae bacterium]
QQVLNSSNLTYADAATLSQYFVSLNKLTEFEAALKKQIALGPEHPEGYFQLAEVMAVTGRKAEALTNLKTSFDLSRKQNSKTLITQAQTDPNLNNLRNLPEFQKLISSK